MSNLSSLVAVVEDELEMPSLSMLKWANVIHAARQVAPLAKAHLAAVAALKAAEVERGARRREHDVASGRATMVDDEGLRAASKAAFWVLDVARKAHAAAEREVLRTALALALEGE